MPTRHNRRSVTETPRVTAALDELRRLSSERIDLGDLVVLGAEHRAAELRAADQALQDRRAGLLERIRTGDVGTDLDAAERVRREGWVRSP